MANRKLSANYIFSAHSGFLKNGMLILDKDNRVIELIDTSGDLHEIANLEYYNGILTPGFVSMYFHLEQSHSRDHNPRSSGFIEHMIGRRLEEMLNFQLNNPQTQLKDLLRWVTINPAKVHGIEEEIGSFENGKRPGVNLIEQVDLQRLILTERSRIKMLV